MQLYKFLTDPSKELIGRRLKVFRLALGKHRSEIANDLCWSLQKWEQWEDGKSLPDLPDMIELADRFELSLDYIYRGDMSRLPTWMSRDIRSIAETSWEMTPHPLWKNGRVRLVARWRTDSNHRFTRNSALGGILRDDQGRGVIYPYSPSGRTRWELSDGDPHSPFWRAHIADLDAHRSFQNFRYSIVTRGGRPIWVITSGHPRFEDGKFVGYAGTGRFVAREDHLEQVA